METFWYRVQTATFSGRWGHIRRPVRAVLNGRFYGKELYEIRVSHIDHIGVRWPYKNLINSAEINQNNTNIGFEYGDVKYVFSDGNILAVKGGKIVEKKSIDDFAKRPADTYRRLQAAVETKKNAVS